jgi:hypothetical protein
MRHWQVEIYPQRASTSSATTTSSTRSRTLSSLSIKTMARSCTSPDRVRNLLEVVAVLRDDGTEIVIHAMRMRRIYEPFLRGTGDADD